MTEGFALCGNGAAARGARPCLGVAHTRAPTLPQPRKKFDKKRGVTFHLVRRSQYGEDGELTGERLLQPDLRPGSGMRRGAYRRLPRVLLTRRSLAT